MFLFRVNSLIASRPTGCLRLSSSMHELLSSRSRDLMLLLLLLLFPEEELGNEPTLTFFPYSPLLLLLLLLPFDVEPFLFVESKLLVLLFVTLPCAAVIILFLADSFSSRWSSRSNGDFGYAKNKNRRITISDNK